MRPMLGDIGRQATLLWSRLGAVQRAVLVGLAALGLVMTAVFVLWARQPDYAVAFSELDEADAAAIVDRLRNMQVPYKISSRGAIMVPRANVHDVRLSMASEGLPKGGKVGFELFDTSALGMTEFYQEVNYRRALEGELARTISSLASVRQARVHLVLPQKTLYTSQRADTTASVMVDLAPGAQLTADQIRSIRYLVASSVEGLDPVNLTIVDTAGNTLSAGGAHTTFREQAIELSAQQLEIQRGYERSLQSEVQAMMEQLVGPGRAIVQTSVMMDWDQIETVSETYTPGDEGGVLRSSRELNESYSGALAQVGGIPGTAANLPPEPDAEIPGAEVAGDKAGAYERSEILHNYEVSRVETKQVNAPGTIKRMAVSVLVDGLYTPEEISDIQEAVVAAVGLDEQRGDMISVKGMPFDRSYHEQEAAAMEAARRQELYLTISKWAGLVILVLVLLLYVRNMLNGLRPPVFTTEPGQVAALSAGGAAASLAGLNPRALQSGQLELLQQARRDKEIAMADQADVPPEQEPEELEPGPSREEMERELRAQREARQRIQRQVMAVAQSEPHAIVQVLRDWLSDEA